MFNSKMKLSVAGVALSFGVIGALSMFIMGILSWQFDYATPMVTLLSSMYIGYHSTLIGSLIGAVWGFFDFLICGALFAWLYNCIFRCRAKKEE